MSRVWQFYGPEEDVLSLDETAKLFGYKVTTLREMIKEGRFPHPRGFRPHQFYTGDDIICIRAMLGRWRPWVARSASEEI